MNVELDPPRRADSGLGPIVWIVGVVSAVLLVISAIATFAPTHRRNEERHEYGGVSWLGDDCRVLDGGVLICLVTQAA